MATWVRRTYSGEEIVEFQIAEAREQYALDGDLERFEARVELLLTRGFQAPPPPPPAPKPPGYSL